MRDTDRQPPTSGPEGSGPPLPGETPEREPSFLCVPAGAVRQLFQALRREGARTGSLDAARLDDLEVQFRSQTADFQALQPPPGTVLAFHGGPAWSVVDARHAIRTFQQIGRQDLILMYLPDGQQLQLCSQAEADAYLTLDALQRAT